MRLGAQWLETYIVCQVLLAAALVAIPLLRGFSSPRQRLWIARALLLSAALGPVLVRVVASMASSRLTSRQRGGTERMHLLSRILRGSERS